MAVDHALLWRLLWQSITFSCSGRSHFVVAFIVVINHSLLWQSITRCCGVCCGGRSHVVAVICGSNRSLFFLESFHKSENTKTREKTSWFNLSFLIFF